MAFSRRRFLTWGVGALAGAGVAGRYLLLPPLDALHLSDYGQDHEGGRRAGEGPSQIFRLEGPAAVFYYRGEPHLHAFVNVAMEADRPLSVGELLGVNPTALDEAGVKALFENAMLSQTDADLAYYPQQSVAGRLRSGPVRTGDLYALESWKDVITRVDVKGATLREPMVEALRRRGQTPRAERTYRIATTGHAAKELAAERLGEVESKQRGPMLRDTVISHLKTAGFPVAS